MTKPLSYLWRMLAFLALVLVAAVPLAPTLYAAFLANPGLNGVIVAVLLGGIAWNIRQVVLLRDEVAWLEAFRNARQGAPARATPRLLAPLASMLSARRSDRLSLSAGALRSVLDGIVSRLDETRELSRYMTGLLIFLGLLGTFWGLLLTISAVADVIGAMSLGSGDANVLFDQLKAGLAQPLRGMGVAFSSSLFGLAGALVLGFLDLTAGQSQNRFATELEDWLAGQTRLSSGTQGGEGGEGDGDAAAPYYVQALLDQMGETLEALHATVARGEAARGATDAALGQLAGRMTVLAEQMRSTQTLLVRLAEHRVAPLTLDEGSRGHLRAIEVLLARMADEAGQGRLQSTAEVRADIKALTRTIEVLSEGAPRG
jgi:hypothetical protein